MSVDSLARAANEPEYSRCPTSLERGSVCVSDGCAVSHHLSYVVQPGFEIAQQYPAFATGEIPCGVYRTLNVRAVRDNDGVVQQDKTFSWRQLPLYGLDITGSGSFFGLQSETGNRITISTSEGLFVFRFFTFDGPSITVTCTLSNPVTRAEVAAHLFIAGSTYNFPSPGLLIPNLAGNSNLKYGSVFLSDGSILNGRVDSALGYILGDPLADFTIGPSLYDEFFPAYCGSVETSEVPVAGEIIENAGVSSPDGDDIFNTTHSGIIGVALTNFNGSEEIHIRRTRIRGRRWRSVHKMPVERCIFTGAVLTNYQFDPCQPQRFRNSADYRCSFEDPVPPRFVSNGTKLGAFNPVDPEQLDGFLDHVVFARCMPGNLSPSINGTRYNATTGDLENAPGYTLNLGPCPP